MPLIEWTEAFETGNEIIDEAHQEIVDEINSLHDSDALSEVPGRLRRIRDMLMEHFVDEEDDMRQSAFDGYAEHKKEHEKVLFEISDLIHNCTEDSIASGHCQPSRHLARLFESHCLNYDKRVRGWEGSAGGG